MYLNLKKIQGICGITHQDYQIYSEGEIELICFDIKTFQ